ncbi:MAG: HAMP domain-containing sensor histidine kinase [Candidatus Eisenbacteria bacterium]
MAFSRSNLPTLLRAYLFLGSFLLISGAFAYSYNWVRKVNQESQAVSRLLARFVAVSALEATANPELRTIFSEVIKPSDLPLVLTDRAGRPFVWNNVGVDPDAIDIGTISQWNPNDEPPPVLRRVLEKVEQMDRAHDPIPIYMSDRQRPFGLVHYGERRLASELRYIPLMQLGVLFVFMALGYIGYRSMKTSEQRAIWIGLAKETAHQLGSPISSLLGWVELARERMAQAEEDPATGAGAARAEGAGADSPVVLPAGFLHEVLNEMEDDADRLNKVAKRFSQVGSAPSLDMTDVVPIVSSAVRYFRRRLPHLKKEIEIRELYELVPQVSLNEELVEWVVENVLKNAVDATRAQGTIKVEVVHRHETECVEVRITDEGQGMTAAQVRQVFSPGYTTKSRGWGLGLTLAKRIIEDYHGGRIWVERTEIGKGSTFVMSFPA